MTPNDDGHKGSFLDGLIGFCLHNKLVVALMTILLVVWGLIVAPFDWELPGLPRDPVPVDAIPDTGENQQIIFTSWPGRSPQDVEDQISYPLTVALLGVPGVKSIRSSSMFGFSSIFVIFDEDVEYYWSRSRLLEKLSSLPAGTLPSGVQAALGPDATPLGQVFWYTLEGRDEDGNPAGGWDLQELRTTQDWYVRYALSSVEGVAEVASIGGYVQEYQVDVDPDAMRVHGITLEKVFKAISETNVDVGARTIEINRAEYVVRGLGLIDSLEDIEQTVVGVTDNVPITVREIGTVSLGPALRRGAIDKGGAEAVGGVVVVRYGANPLAVIGRIKAKIEEISAGLPTRVLPHGRTVQVTVVPFYDRSGLILETLGTLHSALEHEILVTIIVVLLMLGRMRSAAMISGLLPLAVLFCFIAMKYARVDANIVALSGIAIAIGTMVDVGIVITENIMRHVSQEKDRSKLLEAVARGTSEVGGAVMAAVLTTVVSFLPVFTMEGAEGKLFKPLAYTKTFALLGSIVVALVILPAVAHVLLGNRRANVQVTPSPWARTMSWAAAALVAYVLADMWEPLGPGRQQENLLFTVSILGGVLLLFQVLLWCYEPVLRWCLENKLLFLSVPTGIVSFGLLSWVGFAQVAEPVVNLFEGETEEPEGLRASESWKAATETFPGLGKEFMPSLDEGSFLLMPITMAHASIGESLEMLQIQDQLIETVPEVDYAVGKIGRVDSPLDPAPISMVETVIIYKSEYITDESGHRLSFQYDEDSESFVRDETGALVPDDDGRPFRQWRDEVKSPTDIWAAIEEAAKLPGMTSASMLQPIETRQIMLATGMRAPMGIKVFGPDLETIDEVALAFEGFLKDVPSVRAETVFADRVIGKPYIEIDIDRKAIARYGLSVRNVQDVIEVAIGGRKLGTVVDGRERYGVRVRYSREMRDDIEELDNILVAAPGGAQVPLGQLADVRYTPGPQNIKSENTFLVAYVLFDKQPGAAEVDVVEAAQAHLAGLIASGEYALPTGVSFKFAGNYENQQRASARLRVVLPLALFVIFLILYLTFRSTITTGIVFSGVFVAWAGGFLMLWLYGQDWFLDFSVLGTNMRELFQVRAINLSVAVWVGFLALFGIATDDGVLMTTYLDQTFRRDRPSGVLAIRDAVVEAGKRRIRPCLMTTATTTLALIPVLTSTGRGADVMVPMAIPSIGGMTVALITIFVVPTLYCLVEEFKAR